MDNVRVFGSLLRVTFYGIIVLVVAGCASKNPCLVKCRCIAIYDTMYRCNYEDLTQVDVTQATEQDGCFLAVISCPLP